MANFDPYHKWLGIPGWEQPPNHYRLLGLTAFESDPDAIESAADQRMAHVRTFQSSVHSAHSQRLLNELAAAKLCLLSAERKYAYDTELMAKQRSPLVAPQGKWPMLVPKAVTPAPIEVAPPAKRRRPKITLPDVVPTPSEAPKTLLLIAGVVATFLAGFVFYKTRDHSPSQVTAEQAASAGQLVNDDAEEAREIAEARAAKTEGTADSGNESATTSADDFFADDPNPTPRPKATSDDRADFFADDAAPPAAAIGSTAEDNAIDDFFGADGDGEAAKDEFFTDDQQPPQTSADDFFDDATPQATAAAGAMEPRTRDLARWVFSKGGRVTARTSDGGSLTTGRFEDLPRGVSGITEVNLLGLPIGDAELRALDGLAQDIAVLNLAGTKVTDAGMSHVGKLTGLRELYLGGCNISDKGLRELRHLTQLRFLGLYVTRVTDAGVSALRNMKKLEQINLGKTRTTDRAVKRMLPDVSIERPK